MTQKTKKQWNGRIFVLLLWEMLWLPTQCLCIHIPGADVSSLPSPILSWAEGRRFQILPPLQFQRALNSPKNATERRVPFKMEDGDLWLLFILPKLHGGFFFWEVPIAVSVLDTGKSLWKRAHEHDKTSGKSLQVTEDRHPCWGESRELSQTGEGKITLLLFLFLHWCLDLVIGSGSKGNVAFCHDSLRLRLTYLSHGRDGNERGSRGGEKISSLKGSHGSVHWTPRGEGIHKMPAASVTEPDYMVSSSHSSGRAFPSPLLQPHN